MEHGKTTESSQRVLYTAKHYQGALQGCPQPGPRPDLSAAGRGGCVRADRASSAVFWFLILLALGAFAPCVLLPEWREVQTLRRAEQIEQQRVEAMQAALSRQRQHLEAMRRDPAAVARLAQRELSYRRAGERMVPVDVPAVDDSGDESAGGAGDAWRESFDNGVFEAPAADGTPVLAGLAGWLPPLDYDAVFCEPPARSIVLVMSVGLIAVALTVVGRGGRARGYD